MGTIIGMIVLTLVVGVLFTYPKLRTALNLSLISAVTFALLGVMISSILFVPTALFLLLAVCCNEDN
tara:strand:+ start:306 stop:506 length:201 start_codon:yes stop_codon:yes gene_type:complete